MLIDAEINKAIAEFLGDFKDLKRGKSFKYSRDYVNDFNACYEAEKLLTPSQQEHFGGFIYSGRICFVHATARQRSEALLRVLGKWKE